MYNIDKDYFNVIDCCEKAYWLGFLMADGCVLEYKNRKTNKLKAMGLQVSLSKIDEQQIINIKSCLKSNSPITYPKVKCGNVVCDTVKIVFCCTQICRDLIKYGCTPRKSMTLEFTDLNLLNGFESSFIRGYFDGDGSVSFSKNSNYGYNFYCNILGTHNILSQINIILKENNIIAREKLYKANTPELRLTDRYNIKNFFDFIYQDESPYFLQRKYDKFIKGFEYYNLVT